MSLYKGGGAYCGPPAPYPAVQGDPVTEQWWWDHLPNCTQFCEECGDCLTCYWEDPCYNGGEHVWPSENKCTCVQISRDKGKVTHDITGCPIHKDI
jgi:hypothetical protein